MSTLEQNTAKLAAMQERQYRLSVENTMLSKLASATMAKVESEYSKILVRVQVAGWYYRSAEKYTKIAQKLLGKQFLVDIDHFDHWSGDDHDVAYIAVRIKDTSPKELKRAMKLFRKWAPNLKLTFTRENGEEY